MVQWLELRAFPASAVDPGSIPGWEIKFPQATAKKKVKMLNDFAVQLKLTQYCKATILQ